MDMDILTELCQEIRNWFDRDQNKFYGEFVIEDGEIVSNESLFNLKEGQYFRIIGSTFNDGVHEYTPVHILSMTEESFDGSVWAMAVPPSVIALAEDISEWNGLYGGVSATNMSPFKSESFAGYSYTKEDGGSSSGGGGGAGLTWQAAFKDRLDRWRKL